MNRVATAQDGLSVLKIVVYESADLESHFYSGMLLLLM